MKGLTLLKWLPLLFVAIYLSMALQLVPPNNFYGVRTGATLGSEAVWYPANAAAGWVGVVASMAAIFANIHFQRRWPDQPAKLQKAYLATLVTSAGLMAIAGLLAS